jgi:hypothetical protein
MAQEFVIRLWCDRHAMTGERVEATGTVPVSLPGYPDKLLDLCEECHTFLFADLLEVVGKNGRPAGDGREQAARRTAGVSKPTQPTLEPDLNCPICKVQFDSGKAVMTHYRNNHAQKLGISLVELYGRDCPICGAEDLGNLGVHANRAHGSSGIAGSFVEAEADGDQFNVVKEFRERVAAAKSGASRA